MKLTGLLLLVITAAAVSVSGQGTVLFYNHVPNAGIDAPVFLAGSNGTAPLSGPDYVAQLWAAPDRFSSFSPVGSPVPFQTGPGAGYWTPTVVVIPSVAPGATATVVVRVWNAITGQTDGGMPANAASSDILSVVTGGDTKGGSQPPALPAPLTGLKTFSLAVPEPSTFALALPAALLFGAILQRRLKS